VLPIVVLSIVPELMSADVIVAAPVKLEVPVTARVLARVTAPDAPIVVKLPAAAEDPPIDAPSIDPPFMSTESK